MWSLRFSPFTSMVKEILILCPTKRVLVSFGNGRGRNRSSRATTLEMRSFHQHASPLSASGLEHVLLGYISGQKKATEVAHLVWQHIVRKGDVVVDATCGNGRDTLALLKLVADASDRGRVYGMDIQNCALDCTSCLLEKSLNSSEKELVKLSLLCHSRMEEIVPKGTFVRLVAFNLGYLPGGDKAIITLPEKTLQALQAASRLLGPGGLISITAYVGHPGGSCWKIGKMREEFGLGDVCSLEKNMDLAMICGSPKMVSPFTAAWFGEILCSTKEEYEVVQAFATRLPVEHWVCSKFEMINRPAAPVLFFLFKK